MNVRKISPEEIPMVHFTRQDVLSDEEQKVLRAHKLVKAVMISNLEHTPSNREESPWTCPALNAASADTEEANATTRSSRTG